MEGDVPVRPEAVITPPAASAMSLSNRRLSQPGTEEDGDTCRICRGEGTAEQPLFFPCKCSGSIRFVHQECLMEWLTHSQKKYCELCKTPFTFTKLYDQSMPTTLPLALFLQQVVLHCGAAFLRNTRYVLVTLVWLCWLPWSIRQVWRGLFWLADGSWVSKARLQEAALSQLAMVNGDNLTTTLENINNTLHSLRQEALSAQTQMQTSLFSGFVGLFTGDFLLVELAKFVFPSLSRWSQEMISSDAADDPMILLTMDRQPSLLSNVKFLNSLTRYRLLNGALVDVFEGQLICLLIVVAFILVFLIREWVINQQPIINMPDPDNAVEAPRQRNAQDEDRRAARRRQRQIMRRRAQVEADQREDDAPLAVAQPIEPNFGAFRARRHMQHPRRGDFHRPVIAVDEQPETTAEVDPEGVSPTRRSSDISSSRHTLEDEYDEANPRPTLPDRGAFGEMANIQRNLEEGGQNDASMYDTRNDVSLVGVELSDIELNMTERQSGLSPTFSSFNVGSEMSEDIVLDGDIQPNTEVDNQSPQSRLDFELSAVQLSQDIDQMSEDIQRAHSPSDMESINRSASGAIVGEGASVELASVDIPESTPNDSGTVGDDSVNTADEEKTLVGRLFDWFWHLDEDVQDQHPAEQNDEDASNDEENVADDAVAEAPFVPAHNRDTEVANLPDAAVPAPAPPPAPLAQELNMALEVDANNPDAVEDAEDLDGILELIGMQGPLAGMIQNVVFSEFLITLTIAASVWLPYIWGKIALLIIANPVGFFVRMPLFLASKGADFALDLLIFVVGLIALSFANVVKGLITLVGGRLVSWRLPEFLSKMSADMTKSSGTRLEDSLANVFVSFRPDLPSFSLRSHHALRVIEQQLQVAWVNIETFSGLFQDPSQLRTDVLESATVDQPKIQYLAATLATLPTQLATCVVNITAYLRGTFLSFEDKPVPSLQDIDLNLVRWNAQDKLLAIILGYIFFACAGYLYLKVARIFHGLRKDEIIEGIFADSLRQAGGVVKVVVIIGIEMIIFPLYCGLLLDAALLPLFGGVTLQSRIAFMMRAPITGLFVHWFIGTCYMFHFALFVSMCRKIFRKGVLYFIRDPDDPTFHPVRDVLERPVLTQLGKIAFSGFIYGGLVYLCLGGVVYCLSRTRGVLPIHWSTNQPHQAFPVDVIFYNFLLPFILRRTRPSKKVAAMYEWWFRLCARELRLSNFLFGDERSDERGFHSGRALWSKIFGRNQKVSVEEAANWIETDSNTAGPFVKDGGFVRAPASDTVRIPKGNRVFLEVNEKNERLDGKEDNEKGMHGSKDDRFTVVYVPPKFRARIAAFVFLLWAFASTTGVAFTIGPLLIGRLLIQPFTSGDLPANDLYAFTVGLHLCGALAYAIAYFPKARAWIKESTSRIHFGIISYLYPIMKYLLGLLYVGAAACILPVVFSLLAELYIHVPVYDYLSSDSESRPLPESGVSQFISLPPTIFLLQTWTVGLVLVKVILREGFADPEISQAARALRAITRRGYLDPDVGLATRALIVPASLVASALGLAPLAMGRLVNSFLDIEDEQSRTMVYRYCFPGVAVILGIIYMLLSLKRRIALWRSKIRDEVYLIGERLHNYQDTSQIHNMKGKGKVKGSKREN